MSAVYTELKLEVCRFGSAIPTSLVIKPHHLTLCLFLRETIAVADLQLFFSSVLEWDYYYRSQAQGLALYYGPEAPWTVIEELKGKEKVFWTQTQPSVLGDSDGLCVLRGCKLLHHVSGLPSDLTMYLPGRPPALSPHAIAEKIGNGDTADMIAAYCNARERFSEMGEEGIAYLLESLSAIYSAKQQNGVEWFKTAKYGGDKADVISPADVSLKQFLRRFRNFLLNNTEEKPQSKDCNSKEGEGRVVTLHKRLREYEDQINSLARTVSERDATISSLFSRLEVSERVLHDLRSTKIQSPCSEGAGFWQDASLPLPKAPSFQEIAATKPLWIMDKSNWSKSDTTGAHPAQHGSAIALLNPRPYLEPLPRKVRTPMRMAKSGEWKAARKLG